MGSIIVLNLREKHATIYASPDEIYLPEIDSREVISLSCDADKDAYANEYDSSWYLVFEYDDKIIWLDSTALEFLYIDESYDDIPITIKRVREGKTTLKIYAVDWETEKEIKSFKPAYVTIE